MNMAIIPARGGSKRIPRKNVKEFLGRPMMAWAITVAKASGLFKHIVVSTDDEEIAQLARDWGAETPFVRPAELADDLIGTVPVIAHATEFCANRGWISDSDYVCCIYPCSPLLQCDDLSAALQLARMRNAEFVYPVTDYAHPVQRAMRRLASGRMQFLIPQNEFARSQDLEKTYHDAGQFYWGKASAWLLHKKMHTDGLGMPIPNWRVVDIDSPDDWRRAELLFRAINADH